MCHETAALRLPGTGIAAACGRRRRRHALPILGDCSGGLFRRDIHVAPRMCMPHNVAPMTLFKANAGAKGLPAATLTGRSIRNPP